jgi:hypothetical protein
MKKIALVLSVVFFACTISTFAQKSDKELAKEVKEKASKMAKKEAKKYTKDGWEVPAGSLPLAKIFDSAWEKQYQVDDKGNPKYITADGNGIAGNRSAAEMQAIELGKLQLAGLLETKVASLVSANVANTELANNEAQSITEVVQSSKNIIAKELGYINPFFKIFRKLSNGNVEVQCRLFYDASTAMDITTKAIKKELKAKLNTNEEDLKKLMGM